MNLNLDLSAKPPEEPPRDSFMPPAHLEQRARAFIEAMRAYAPPQPDSAPLSLANAPATLTRHEAVEVMNSCARWMEFFETQAGGWMQDHVEFTYGGKLDKLTPEQFQHLQDYRFRAKLLQAEIKILDSHQKEQQKVANAASRNLSSLTAP